MEPGRVATQWGWVGDYELVSRIAIGGMGEVFLARQHGTAGFRRLVAVKRLIPDLASETDLVELFIDEARIAAQLAHPNIVQIHELGRTDEGAFFISMEYVPGQNLAKVLRKARELGRPLPLDVALLIGCDLCDALDYAHDARDVDGRDLELVHRDVSPHNVLVSYGGAVKLMDFGIAKATSALHRTATGVIRGKYAYMSPEHVAGRSVDRRADIYSAGVVLWELVCGERLFGGTTEIEELREAVRAEIRSPLEVRPELGASVDAVIMRALDPDPAARFATAADLGAALRDIGRERGLELDRANLVALIDGLFAKEREATEAIVDEATSTASIGAVAAAAQLGDVAAPAQPRAAQALVPPTEPTALKAKSAKRGLIFGVVAALAIAAVGAALVWWPGLLEIEVAAVVAPPEAVDAAPAPVLDAAEQPLLVIDAAPIEVDARRRTNRKPPTRADAAPTRPTPRADASVPKPPGILVIDSTPWGDAVVRGHRGPTPLRATLKPGSYSVSVTPSDGTAALRSTATIASGKRTKCIARARRLVCSPPQ